MTRASRADADSPWYLDETTVLDELRRIAQARPKPPVIHGYDDLHELHRGGQGIIYAAIQRSTNRRVAIKVLLDGNLASDSARHRFQREIDLVASLRHPNIVRIYDSGISEQPDARVYFVMEFIEGIPLHEFARHGVSPTRPSPAPPRPEEQQPRDLRNPRLPEEEGRRESSSPPLPRGEGRGEGSPLPLPRGEGRGEGSPLPLPRGEGRGEGSPLPLPRGEGRGEGSPLPLPRGEGRGEGSSLPLPRGEGRGEGSAPHQPPNHRIILQLFAKVCRAVHHAHQHGVIHRDLKPSNIRVDAEGEPHVLDFGLAKAARRDDPFVQAPSAVSIAGQFVGSLPWASPEQAQGDQLAVDVRSDVYSLGVILFQLLTGKFPYNVDGRLREVLDRITGQEPTRPSTLNPAIDGEVETITLKCLAKDVARRYQSAAELAQDIEHYLAGEPIQARRDSAWYTMRKRLRRYRAATAAAVLLAVTLIAGIGATLWQNSIAREERDTARQRFEDVRSLARTVIFDVHDQIENLPGSRPARAALVATALEYLEKLARDAGDDSGVRAELAAGYRRVGDLQGAPNAPNLGDTAGALASYERAIEHAEALARQPDRAAEATSLLIEIHSAISAVQAARGQIADAVEHARSSLSLAESNRAAASAGDRNTSLAAVVAHIKLGDVLGHPSFANAGRTADAVAEYAAAEALLAPLAAAHPDDRQLTRYVALLHERHGQMLEVHGRPADAFSRYEQSLAIRAALVNTAPDDANALRDLAIAHEKLGNAHRALGRREAAGACYADAARIFDRLAQVDPLNITAQRNSAINHERIGDLKLDAGDITGAVQSLRTSASMFADIAGRDPGNEQSQLMSAIAHIKLGDVLGNSDFRNAGLPDESLTHYQAALDILGTLYNADAANVSRKRYFALVHERLGTMRLLAGDASTARESLQLSLQLRRELAEHDARAVDIQRDLGVAHEKLGKLCELEHDDAAALTEFRAARAVYASLADAYPDTPQFTRDLENVDSHLAHIANKSSP